VVERPPFSRFESGNLVLVRAALLLPGTDSPSHDFHGTVLQKLAEHSGICASFESSSYTLLTPPSSPFAARLSLCSLQALGASPKLAWITSLASDARALREFSATFSEAIEM